MEETRSELQRDNRALSDRVEVLELRQRNRQLMRRIKRLEAKKESDFGGLTSKQETIGIVIAVIFSVFLGIGIVILINY